MPRNGRAADREIAGDAVDRLAALAQERQDGAAGGIGEGLEDVALVRPSGHCLVTHIRPPFLIHLRNGHFLVTVSLPIVRADGTLSRGPFHPARLHATGHQLPVAVELHRLPGISDFRRHLTMKSAPRPMVMSSPPSEVPKAAVDAATVKRYLPWVVATALFMEQLDSTIVNTAVPSMAASLHVTPLSLKAVVTSYILSLAVCIPVSGWIADRYGTRRVFALGGRDSSRSRRCCAACRSTCRCWSRRASCRASAPR